MLKSKEADKLHKWTLICKRAFKYKKNHSTLYITEFLNIFGSVFVNTTPTSCPEHFEKVEVLDGDPVMALGSCLALAEGAFWKEKNELGNFLGNN